jgi:hypothetical protein
MIDSGYLLHLFRQYLGIILFGIFAAVLLGAWVVYESFRLLRRQEDYELLRRRVEHLEQAQASLQSPGPALHSTRDPIVLEPRWIPKGHSATTSDGGCLMLVDDVLPGASQALLTLRVDGLPVMRRHLSNLGDVLELTGHYGTYTIQLIALSGIQAQLAAWLRNRHQDPARAAAGA